MDMETEPTNLSYSGKNCTFVWKKKNMNTKKKKGFYNNMD